MTGAGYVRKVLRALKANGWDVVAVDDGGDELVPVTNEKETIEAVLAVESSHVILKNGQARGWFFVVWQGPPTEDVGENAEDVVADYTTNLPEVF
jgi:hypothetical protein